MTSNNALACLWGDCPFVLPAHTNGDGCKRLANFQMWVLNCSSHHSCHCLLCRCPCGLLETRQFLTCCQVHRGHLVPSPHHPRSFSWSSASFSSRARRQLTLPACGAHACTRYSIPFTGERSTPTDRVCLRVQMPIQGTLPPSLGSRSIATTASFRTRQRKARQPGSQLAPRPQKRHFPGNTTRGALDSTALEAGPCQQQPKRRCLEPVGRDDLNEQQVGGDTFMLDPHIVS